MWQAAKTSTMAYNEWIVRYLMTLVEKEHIFENTHATERCQEAAIYSLADICQTFPSLSQEIADFLLRLSDTHKSWEVRTAAIRTLPKVVSYVESPKPHRPRRTIKRKLNLFLFEKCLKWLSIFVGVGLVGSVILNLQGIDEVGDVQLRTVINILTITIGGSLFSWGGISVFSMKNRILDLENLKIEKCPFANIVDNDLLSKFGHPGSVGFCTDLIRCHLYRYKEHCKIAQNYLEEKK